VHWLKEQTLSTLFEIIKENEEKMSTRTVASINSLLFNTVLMVLVYRYDESNLPDVTVLLKKNEPVI
jgi:hypothetical protein